MAVLPPFWCWGVLGVLVAPLLLAPRSTAWQIATDQIAPGCRTYIDWATKEGKNAEIADSRKSLVISEGDQNRDVRKEYEEALKSYRQSALKDPETYSPHVAATLNNLGILDSQENRITEARAKYEEALNIYRELVQKNPETYLPELAATLNNLGMLDRAKSRIEEALKIWRELARKDPETYLPLVATALNNVGILGGGQNRLNEARKEHAEALKIYRKLAQKDLETYLPYVAMTLNQLGMLDSAQNRFNLMQPAKNIRKHCKPIESWRKTTRRPICLTLRRRSATWGCLTVTKAR